MISVLAVALLLLSESGVTITQGTSLASDPAFTVANIDPTLRSPLASQIYDPNFIPGFQAGLQNISVTYSGENGRAAIGYSVGPWVHAERGIPHLAVGPQCCNFEEIPRTQQYRKVEWGDYYHVRAGFTSPGVNFENYTTDFSSPAYVGLRTDWDWSVSVSLDWSQPVFLSTYNRWTAIGITATQFVPEAPNRLVYTVVNFWSDENSSSVTRQPAGGGVPSTAVGSNVVVYHPVQLSGSGNRTIEIKLSPYLKDTLDVLGFAGGAKPPVISYVYLNVEGYNFRWNSTLYSFFVMSDSAARQSSILDNRQIPLMVVFTAAIALVVLVAYALRRGRGSARSSRGPFVNSLACDIGEGTSVALLKDEKGLVTESVERESGR